MPVRRFGFLVLCVQLAQTRTGSCQESVRAAPAASCVNLRWTCDGDVACPARSDIEAAVAEVLDRPGFEPRACERLFDARLTRSPAGSCDAALRVQTQDGATLGSRDLVGKSDSCADLLGPVALVMALMLDSTQAHARLRVQAGPSAGENETRSIGARMQLSAAGAFAWGLLPGTSIGPQLRVGARWSDVISAHLEGATWLPVGASEPRADFWAFHAGGSACTRVAGNTEARLALCAGTRAGMLTGSGAGLDYNLSSSKPYVQSDLAAWAHFPFSGALAIATQLGLGVPWVRPRFVYLDSTGEAQHVHRPRAWVVFGGIGIELSEPWLRGGAAPTGRTRTGSAPP